MHKHIATFLIIFFLSSVAPASAVTTTETKMQSDQPFTQDLVITAYYSPLPDQCCYVKGNFQDDVVLNGEGLFGADGTAVKEGMVAAPPSYPFGTRIVLPGIGTVTVHDRGGAIQEQGSTHRLDLWVGYGEEGLARALAFGVKRVTATIYPPLSKKPEERMSIASLPAPPEQLRPYIADDTTLLDIHAKSGDVTASVAFLQEKLRSIGVFQEKSNGSFGKATAQALGVLFAQIDAHEPTDQLTLQGAALIEAAYARRDARDALAATIDPSTRGGAVFALQRTLRFLGYYNGRTNGVYSSAVEDAVFAFQKARGLLAERVDPGAGRVGPKTLTAINGAMRAAHIKARAKDMVARTTLLRSLADRGIILSGFLNKGDRGATVKQLQHFLAEHGFLAADAVTGTYGEKTVRGVLDFQIAEGIVRSADDRGAGGVGPATLGRIRILQESWILRTVRERGIQAV